MQYKLIQRFCILDTYNESFSSSSMQFTWLVIYKVLFMRFENYLLKGIFWTFVIYKFGSLPWRSVEKSSSCLCRILRTYQTICISKNCLQYGHIHSAEIGIIHHQNSLTLAHFGNRILYKQYGLLKMSKLKKLLCWHYKCAFYSKYSECSWKLQMAYQDEIQFGVSWKSALIMSSK